jgi:hypothetical protein
VDQARTGGIGHHAAMAASMRSVTAMGLLSASLLGCLDPAEVVSEEMTVVFISEDFQSDVLHTAPDSNEGWVGVLGVRWEGTLEVERRTEAAAYFASHMFLVSLEDGARVAGEVRPELLTTGGAPADLMARGSGAFSFVPAEVLPEGWYALVIDARAWPTPGSARFQLGTWGPVPVATEGDRVGFVRVHVGSNPVWYLSDVSCEDGTNPGSPGPSCRVGVGWSEEIATLGDTSFRLRVDGAEIDCGTLDVAERGAGWVCPPLAPATLTITIEPNGAVGALSPDSASHTFRIEQNGVLQAQVDPGFGIDAIRAAL